jgi:hypothetical protein
MLDAAVRQMGVAELKGGDEVGGRVEVFLAEGCAFVRVFCRTGLERMGQA